MPPHLQPRILPRLEVIPRRDGASHPVRSTNRPELVEGRRALDRRFIDALLGHDLVLAPVARHVALHLGLGVVRGLVRAVGLDDVVLD